MTPSINTNSVAKTIAAIEALDLSLIKFKATRGEDGYGWSAEYADQMERAYKRYLILHAKYPDMTLAPEQDVDRFWHMHILDTRKYAADCEATFGYFLHHFPYLGLRGADDAKVLESAFEQMQQLYMKEFGEPMSKEPQRDAAWCAVESKAAWCAVETGAQGKAAWCAMESPMQAKAAWCAMESPAQAKAAWCAMESPMRAKAAWCAMESPAQAKAAWCAMESQPPGKAAWCALESGTQARAAAWCAIEAVAPTRAAWCAVESAGEKLAA